MGRSFKAARGVKKPITCRDTSLAVDLNACLPQTQNINEQLRAEAVAGHEIGSAAAAGTIAALVEPFPDCNPTATTNV